MQNLQTLPDQLTAKPNNQYKIVIRWRAMANGAWKYVRTQRGYYRVAVVDMARVGDKSGRANSHATRRIWESAETECHTPRGDRQLQAAREIARMWADNGLIPMDIQD